MAHTLAMAENVEGGALTYREYLQFEKGRAPNPSDYRGGAKR